MFLRLARAFLYALIALVPLAYLPLSLDPLEVSKQTLLVLLTFASALCWIGAMVSARAVSVRRGWLNLLPLLILVSALISASLSLGPYLSWIGTATQEYTSALSIAAYVTLFYLVANLMNVPSAQRTALFTLLVSASLAGAFGVAASLGVPVLPSADGPLGNTVGTANAFGTFLAAMAVLGNALFLVHREEDALMYRGTRGTLQHVLVIWLSAAAFATALALDFTPVWLTLLAGLLALFVFALVRAGDFGPTNRFILPFALIVASLPFLFWVDRPIPIRIPTEVTPSFPASWDIAKETVKADGALFGSGPGTFVYQYAKYRPLDVNRTAFWDTRFDRASSSALTVLVTFGLVGALVWALFLSITVTRGALEVVRGRERHAWLPAFVVLPPFFALAVSGFLYSANLTLLFLVFLLSGLVAGAVMKRPAMRSLRESPRLSLAFSLLAIFAGTVIVTGVFVASLRYAAEAAFAKAVRLDRAGGDLKDVVASLDRAASLNRANDVYYRNLSQAFLLMLASALKEASALAQAGSEDQRGYLQALTGAAVNASARATELGPENVLNWAARGALYRELVPLIGNAGEFSTKALQRAIELDPRDPKVRTELGRTYLTLAENNRALTAAEDKAVAREAQAKVESLLKQAEEQFLAASALKEDYAPAQYQLALVLERQGRLPEAVAKMETVAKQNPLDVGVAFQLGLLYMRRGDTLDVDRAQAAFSQAVALSPSYSNARWFLASIHEQKKEIDKAIEQVAKVLEYDPGNELVKARLERLRAGKALSTPPPPLEETPTATSVPEGQPVAP